MQLQLHAAVDAAGDEHHPAGEFHAWFSYCTRGTPANRLDPLRADAIDGSTMPPGTMRALTLNCWNISPPFEERMALIRAGIEALAPDLVALQEIIVRRDGFDQAAVILDGLGYHRVFGAALRWDDTGTLLPLDAHADGAGNVIAARWPIVRSALHPLPGVDGEERRSVLLALVDTPAGRLPFVTTHLEWRFDHGHVRERQVLALAGLVADWSRDAPLPVVLVGDFNAEPDATEMRFLRGLATLAGRSTYFQDAWQLAGDGGRGTTWDNRNPYAAAMFEPDRRIDYLLVGAPDREGRGWIETARVVFDTGHDGVFPSDHFGVLADVRV